MKIKRTKHGLAEPSFKYKSKSMMIGGTKDFLVLRVGLREELFLLLREAKELSKVLPKFLEEVEK